MNEHSLLALLQLVSPSLPLGAYNYSESLEYLIDTEQIKNALDLRRWLDKELQYGNIRAEASVMLRVYDGAIASDWSKIAHWNSWLQGNRETRELRQQSIQMGESLLRLLDEVSPSPTKMLGHCRESLRDNCHYAVAYGVAIALWQINAEQGLLGFLHSWVANLVGAGIKLIPLGQTSGQQLIWALHSTILEVADELQTRDDQHLSSCTWGLSLASMNHETQYTRLFRS